MKKIILLIIVSCTVVMATAQQTERFTFATSVGTGIDMNEPSATPFTWQALGYYAINKRFSVGIGTGLSIYEKALIPLFADAKFLITKPRKFTPYIECGEMCIRDRTMHCSLSPCCGSKYQQHGNQQKKKSGVPSFLAVIIAQPRTTCSLSILLYVQSLM